MNAREAQAHMRFISETVRGLVSPEADFVLIAYPRTGPMVAVASSVSTSEGSPSIDRALDALAQTVLTLKARQNPKES